MYTKSDIKKYMADMGIKGDDTLLVHSSMKSIGKVENGADTVIDAFIEYMSNGLLVFPTHTWAQMNDDYNVFNPKSEPSCVGILSNIFMKRPEVLRTLHPTHSVAAIGKDAESFVRGEEQWDTPCPRNGCWGKLYDKKAKVLFIGCSLKCNTLLHGVEEWNKVPMRLAEKYQQLKIIAPDGHMLNRPLYRHYHPLCDVSDNYDKLEVPLLYLGIARKGRIGDAECILCDVEKMVDLTTLFLKYNPDLFADKSPIPAEWYVGYDAI